MPAFGQIKLCSILDNAAARISTDANIGVDNTFDPDGRDANGVSRYSNRAGGIAVGYPWCSFQIRKPTKVSRVYKVTVKLFVPTLEVTSPSTGSGIQPAPTKAYEVGCIMEFFLPERSTNTERLRMIKLVQSLFLQTINASDGTPSDATGSPLGVMVTQLEDVY
jgi:hypothetical protein